MLPGFSLAVPSNEIGASEQHAFWLLVPSGIVERPSWSAPVYASVALHGC